VLASFGWIATTTVAEAQVGGRYRRDTLTNSSYERLRQWAHELDEVARHASEQARAQQAGYRGFRRDSNFLKSIDHFADRAEKFHERMDNYRTQPWKVDDEIEHLLRDAREVQRRLQRARFVDRHTVEDWDEAVDLLNRMMSEYRSPGRFTDDRYRRYPDRDHDRYDSRYSTDIGALARELEERALRMSQLAVRNRYDDRYGFSSGLRRFSDEARDFRVAVDSRDLSRSELRSRVNRLLEEARDAYSEVTRAGGETSVAVEWDGVVRVLDRMRDLVA
jgi:hypothetical protein